VHFVCSTFELIRRRWPARAREPLIWAIGGWVGAARCGARSLRYHIICFERSPADLCMVNTHSYTLTDYTTYYLPSPRARYTETHSRVITFQFLLIDLCTPKNLSTAQCVNTRLPASLHQQEHNNIYYGSDRFRSVRSLFFYLVKGAIARWFCLFPMALLDENPVQPNIGN
jgi:hypothetical protein